MIVIKKVFDPIDKEVSFHASLYSGNEPMYDLVGEAEDNAKRLKLGLPIAYGPGPGLHRILKNCYMSAGGVGPDIGSAIKDMSSRRALRPALKRLERARRKAKFEEARYDALVNAAGQRVFDAQTNEEVSDEASVTVTIIPSIP